MNSTHLSIAPLQQRYWPLQVGNVDIPQPPPNVVPTPGPPGQPLNPPSPPEIDPPPPPEIKEPPGVAGDPVPVGEPPWPQIRPIQGHQASSGFRARARARLNAAKARRHAINR